MLLKPSELLKVFKVESPREYAVHIYKQLLQFTQRLDLAAQDQNIVTSLNQVDFGQAFTKAFYHQADAFQCIQYLKQQIILGNNNNGEEYIVLPPTFLRSSIDLIVEIDMLIENSNCKILTVLCKQGPVIPIVVRQNKVTLYGNDNFRTCLLSILSATSGELVTENNFAKIINIQKTNS